MLKKTTKPLSAYFLFTLLTSISFSAQALDFEDYSALELSSCDVEIQSDTQIQSDQGVTFEGNVTVLIGFAQLKADRLTLVESPPGNCELIAEHNYSNDSDENDEESASTAKAVAE